MNKDEQLRLLLEDINQQDEEYEYVVNKKQKNKPTLMDSIIEEISNDKNNDANPKKNESNNVKKWISLSTLQSKKNGEQLVEEDFTEEGPENVDSDGACNTPTCKERKQISNTINWEQLSVTVENKDDNVNEDEVEDKNEINNNNIIAEKTKAKFSSRKPKPRAKREVNKEEQERKKEIRKIKANIQYYQKRKAPIPDHVKKRCEQYNVQLPDA